MLSIRLETEPEGITLAASSPASIFCIFSCHASRNCGIYKLPRANEELMRETKREKEYFPFTLSNEKQTRDRDRGVIQTDK